MGNVSSFYQYRNHTSATMQAKRHKVKNTPLLLRRGATQLAVQDEWTEVNSTWTGGNTRDSPNPSWARWLSGSRGGKEGGRQRDWARGRRRLYWLQCEINLQLLQPPGSCCDSWAVRPAGTAWIAASALQRYRLGRGPFHHWFMLHLMVLINRAGWIAAQWGVTGVPA